MLGRHAPYRFAGAEEASDHIGRKDARDARGVDVFEPRLTVEDACVVDQRVERTQRFVHLGEQANHVGFGTHVARDGHCPAACGFDVAYDRRCGFPIAEIVDSHRIAVGCRQACRRGADAAAGAGDEHRPGHCVLASFAVNVAGFLCLAAANASRNAV
jgi:hypothetical protein